MNRSRTRTFAALSWRAWVRQLGDAPSVPIALAIVTFVLAGCLAIAPRIVDHASERDVRAQLADATVEQRNIRFERSGRIGVSPAGDPMDRVRQTGDDLLDDVPESVTSTIVSQRFVVDTPRLTVVSYEDEDDGPFPTTIVFRTQEDVTDELELVAGEWPTEQPTRWLLRGSDCPDDIAAEDYERDPEADDADCNVVTAPVFDTLLSTDTADTMGLTVGDEAILFPDPRDLGWRQGTGQQFGRRFVLRVAGLVELSDSGLDYWFGDTSLHRPRITENADYRLIYATGLLDSERYQDFLRATVGVPLRYTWRSTIDIDRVGSERAAELADDVDRLAPDDADVITQLPDILRSHLDQKAVTIGVMSAIVSGLFAAAIGGLAALALVGANRYRPTYRLVVDRGATGRHVLVEGLRTGALVVLPTAVAGWVGARLAVPESRDALSIWLAVVTALLAIAVASAATVSVGRHRHRSRVARPGEHRLSRRLVGEVLLAVVAGGAVLLLRRRGDISTPGVARDFDPLLAIAASLAAFACAVVLVHAAVPLTRAVASVAARRRGAVGFVGARIATFHARTTRATLIVMITAVSIAAFATTIGASVERTQQSRSWAAVGGDYRIASLNRALPLASLTELDRVTPPGAFADAFVTADVSAVGPAGATFVEMTALRVDDYLDEVVGGRSDVVDTEALEALRDATAVWDPDGVDPIPALVSSRWPASTALRVGDGFSMGLGGTGRENYSALDLVDEIAGATVTRPAVLVDLTALEARLGSRAADTNVRIGRASRADVDRLADDLDPAADGVVVQSRYEVLDEVAGDPFATWMRRTWTAVIVLSGAVAALAAVAAFEISAARRDRDLSVLRTLGLRRRETGGVVAFEQLPVVAFAMVLGTAVGLAIAWLLHPALRLERLAGEQSAAAPTIAFGRIGAVATGVTVAIAAAVAIAVWRLVRRNDASMLRTGDDG